MLKIKIISPGKMKERWLEEALSEYEKRLTGSVSIEWILKEVQPDSPYLCLHPEGKAFTSPDFSKFLYKEWEKQGSRLTFVIGGPTGLSPQILRDASQLISLSNLTFTHQHTRLVLLEQIYRATQIEKGTDYHK